MFLLSYLHINRKIVAAFVWQKLCVIDSIITFRKKKIETCFFFKIQISIQNKNKHVHYSSIHTLSSKSACIRVWKHVNPNSYPFLFLLNKCQNMSHSHVTIQGSKHSHTVRIEPKYQKKKKTLLGYRRLNVYIVKKTNKFVHCSSFSSSLMLS